MQTIVIGHRNPDMDSICSALGYARLKQALGWRDVVAARAGNLNARIQFALDKFGAEPPVFLSDVTPQVRDVMTREVISARADHSVAQALRSIEKRRFRGLPVVDESNRCLGLLSTLQLVQQFFPPLGRVDSTRQVRAALGDIAQTFEGVFAVGEVDTAVHDYILMVAAAKTATMVQRLRQQPPSTVVLIVGDRDNIQDLAIDAAGPRAHHHGRPPGRRGGPAPGGGARGGGHPLAPRHGHHRPPGPGRGPGGPRAGTGGSPASSRTCRSTPPVPGRSVPPTASSRSSTANAV